jgi:uncharacterized protein YqgC (DUF456 family)
MTWLPAGVVVVGAVLGAAMTLVMLPGMWVALAVAIACAWWEPSLLSWWTIAAAAGIAVAGEAVETFAAGAGARRLGASRRGMGFAVVGGIVGAIAGTVAVPVPVVGTLVGAVAGAALGAFIAERGIEARTWRQAARAAGGAAGGRLAASALKAGLGAVQAAVLIAGVLR